jgi:alpha-acetolactate decarboxylase
MIRRALARIPPAALPILVAVIHSLDGTAPARAQSHQSPDGAQSAQYLYDFKAYGIFRRMITERNYLPVVTLKDAVGGGVTDAVGAVSGLRGEISVIEGHLIVSYGAECRSTCGSDAADETATLLATAAVRNWRAVPIVKNLDAAATQIFIREQAKAFGLDENKPFPFRITGTITNFVMHVNAAPNPRFKGHGSFDQMAITGLAKGPLFAGYVVGFYAPPPLQGIVTHGGDFFHSHYVDEQRLTTAHLDTYGAAAGSTLMLPMAK